MDVNIHTYQISCESQLTLSVQISKYAWGYTLITLSYNGVFFMMTNNTWVTLPNQVPVEIIRFANSDAVMWDKKKMHIYFLKAGKKHACRLDSSFTPKIW